MNSYNYITASFDVDAEKGFSSDCPNELPVLFANNIVPALNAQAEYATIRVFSKDWHSPNAVWCATENEPQFTPVEGLNVDVRWNSHCNGGTLGSELLDGLPDHKDYDFGVYKGLELDMHPYGACYHDLANTKTTGVIEFLKSKNVNFVIVGGLATDHCVFHTVMQLLNAGFRVIVNKEACRGIDHDATKTAYAEMTKAGADVVATTDEIANVLGGE